MRSKVRASELVAAATFCWICSLSRSMRRYRSASRAFSSRSGEAVGGVALQLFAQAGQLGSTSWSRGGPLRLPLGTAIPAVADRSAEATSRRTRGWRCSTRLGSVIEPTFAEAPE